MAIKIGTSNVRRVFLGTSKAKLIYLDTKLVFADPQQLTINIGEGIANITYTATSIDGKISVGSLVNSGTFTFGYGTKISFTYSVEDGYQIGSYTTSTTMTSDQSVSFTAIKKNYNVAINLKYLSTSYGTKLGSVQYSTNNSTWYSTTGPTLSLTYGSKLYIKNITAKAGFTLSTVKYNNVTYGTSGGIYTITVGAGNYNLDINYASKTSTSSVTFIQAESITTNTLTKTGFNVSMDISIHVKECTAGTVIGTVPTDYRPSSSKSYTTTWRVQSGTLSSTSEANITVNTNGVILSDTDSDGSGSGSGGGKWGGYEIEWYTQIVISASWSV